MIWRLSDKTLETVNNSEVRMKVRVLGEELAYNKSLRQFKMFILEQPLDPNYKVGVRGDTGCSMCAFYEGATTCGLFLGLKTSTSNGTHTPL